MKTVIYALSALLVCPVSFADSCHYAITTAQNPRVVVEHAIFYDTWMKTDCFAKAKKACSERYFEILENSNYDEGDLICVVQGGF